MTISDERRDGHRFRERSSAGRSRLGGIEALAAPVRRALFCPFRIFGRCAQQAAP